MKVFKHYVNDVNMLQKHTNIKKLNKIYDIGQIDSNTSSLENLYKTEFPQDKNKKWPKKNYHFPWRTITHYDERTRFIAARDSVATLAIFIKRMERIKNKNNFRKDRENKQENENEKRILEQKKNQFMYYFNDIDFFDIDFFDSCNIE